MSKSLTPEASMFLKIVQNYSYLSFEQAGIILGDPDKAVRILQYLYHCQYINIIDEKYAAIKPLTTVNMDIIQSIWVVMDTLTVEDALDLDNFMNSICNPSGGQVLISFIRNEKYIINISCIRQSNIIDVSYIQNRFYMQNQVAPGKEKECGIAYYFIVSDPKTQMDIDKLNLKIPYIIVNILPGSTPDMRPQIQYINQKK